MRTDEVKKAVVYARYSSDNQTEQSIEGQLRVCEEYAKANGIIIMNTYIDRAMTGTNDNRPSFRQMIKDSSNHEWNYVIVYKFDRFSRNKYETVLHKKTLKDNGVKVLSAMENIPDSPEGVILESVIEGMSQYYSEELSQKVKRGMKQSRINGLFQGGSLPYGYKLTKDKHIAINEYEAPIVKYIFEQYIKGRLVKDIMRELNSKNIKNKNKPFSKTTLYAMLGNEKYTGIYRHKDELYTKTYPPIISKQLFQKVQIMLKGNSKGRTGVKVPYLLSKKLICGYCGCHITADAGTSRNKKIRRYYKCAGRKEYHNGCTKKIEQKDLLKKLVVKSIVRELSKPNILNSFVDKIMQLQKIRQSENNPLSILEQERRRVKNAIDNILNAIENGVCSQASGDRLKDLEQQLNDLNGKIDIESKKIPEILTRDQVTKYFKAALKSEPQLLINYLVKQIVLYDDLMEIHFYNPTLVEDPDSNSGSSLFITYSREYTKKVNPDDKLKERMRVKFYLN